MSLWSSGNHFGARSRSLYSTSTGTLVEQSADPDRTVIISGRVPSRLRTGKTTDLTSSALSSRHGALDPAWTLPKGDYDLYLLTDGSPAKVTIRLGGLTGATALKPSRKAAFTVKQPAERLLGQGASSAGTTPSPAARPSPTAGLAPATSPA